MQAPDCAPNSWAQSGAYLHGKQGHVPVMIHSPRDNPALATAAILLEKDETAAAPALRRCIWRAYHRQRSQHCWATGFRSAVIRLGVGPADRAAKHCGERRTLEGRSIRRSPTSAASGGWWRSGNELIYGRSLTSGFETNRLGSPSQARYCLSQGTQLATHCLSERFVGTAAG